MEHNLNILNFDYPPTYFGLLYACFISVALYLLFGSGIVGVLFGIANTDMKGLFHRLFIFVSVHTVGYALIMTSGATSLAPLLFFGLSMWYLHWKNKPDQVAQPPRMVWPTTSQFTAYFTAGTILFLIFLTLLFDFQTGEIRYLHHSEITPYGVDSPFYVRLGEFLNFAGMENISSDFYSLNQLSPSPYHWFELWYGALIYTLFPVNSETLWCLVVNPTLFLMLVVGVFAIGQQLTGSESKGLIAGFIMLVVGTYGFLIPEHLWLVGEFGYTSTIFGIIKAIPVYMSAALVVLTLLSDNYRLIPYHLALFGLMYQPLLPVGFISGAIVAAVVLYTDRSPENCKSVGFWMLSAFLTAIWLIVLFSNSDISYSSGSGIFSKLFDGFEFIQFIKICIRRVIEMALPNLPILILATVVWFDLSDRIVERNRFKKAFLTVVMVQMTGLFISALLYKMLNSSQIWFIAYLSINGIAASALLTYGLFKGTKLARVYALLLVIVLVPNAHFNLGKGNNIHHSELERLAVFVAESGTDDIRMAYLGGAGGNEMDGLFKYTLHILYPLRQLGLILSPYVSTGLSALDMEKEAGTKLKPVEKKILSYSSMKRFAERNHLSAEDTGVKRKFVEKNNVTHLVFPEYLSLPSELIDLVSRSDTFFGFKIYEISLDNNRKE
ncbi:MAG: hypothetical protein ACJAYA_000400 [Bacteroidia bacterium]|jgi:hypothetical protein